MSKSLSLVGALFGWAGQVSWVGATLKKSLTADCVALTKSLNLSFTNRFVLPCDYQECRL